MRKARASKWIKMDKMRDETKIDIKRQQSV